MQRISSSRQVNVIQENCGTALSDHEDSYASKGFIKMAKLSLNMPKQFMDDSEVCTPASAQHLNSPCKIRKAIKLNALKETKGHQIVEIKQRSFEITLD